MARFNVRLALCIALFTVGVWIESIDAEPAQSVEDDYDDKHLHDILPMATEAVEKMLELLRKNAGILAFLPQKAKVVLARE